MKKRAPAGFYKSWEIYDIEDLKISHSNPTGESKESVFHLDLLSIIAEGFSELAEYRDNDTGMHIKHISKMTEIIAKDLMRNVPELRINHDFVQILRISSPLHDIGKVMVPDDILNKPGKLTDAEFDVIKKHTVVGYRILNNLHHKICSYGIDYFLIAGQIALEHHEKYDGSGYPKGLKGNDICLEAQITALVDVYDALRSKRPYKEPFSNARTREIILSESGKHFNPVIVASFERVEQELDRIFRLFVAEEGDMP